MSAYVHDESEGERFTRSREQFEAMLAGLADPAVADLTHTELEDQLADAGRDLLRMMFQDHLDLRAVREDRRPAVTDAEGIVHTRVERGHDRDLGTVFGTVRVTRMAYRAPGAGNLYPADAVLNLPAGKHSHGLRRLAAAEAARGSFADAATAIERATGITVGKRQVEELTRAAAIDVEAFYAAHRPDPAPPQDVLVISADGKGVVMRPEALRAATARAGRSRKLSTRLSRGEKRDRKRMAEVAAVYDLTARRREPADIITVPTHAARGDSGTASSGGGSAVTPRPAPRARGKWLTASLTHTTAEVIAVAFDEAERRDPEHARPWVALVDGNAHQIQRIHTEADRRGIPITIVVDFVHVMEYLWKAAWCFYREADPAAETWVAEHALRILNGHAGTVAAAIRRKATTLGLDPARRRNADTTATYLINKKSCLDYPTALASGWPIATGVIEGACRHLVKDRTAPRGAPPYPQFNWEKLGGRFLGLMAYLDPKGEGDRSMPGKYRSCSGV